MIFALALISLVSAAIPALVFFLNLRLYQPPPTTAAGVTVPSVSILIPARNEAAGIGEALEAALRTRGVAFEIIVMDDSSTDGTGEIVQSFARIDPRVRLATAPALPPGWNGKQHACWALANAARYPALCFVDADVRLQPDCIARMSAFLTQQNDGQANALVSGFPRELTGSPFEWLLLPLIHFVLLGFLPVGRMRAGTDPAFAAGCGQFFMARRDAYFATGGHSQIRLTMHDGLRLPRLFRQHGYRTDLADLTALATCRMYRGARETWLGLAKNATEGMAAPARIVPITLLFLAGQVLPFLWLSGVCTLLCHKILVSPSLVKLLLHHAFVFGITQPLHFAALMLLIAAVLLAWSVRFAAARRFRQDWRSALLHPLGISLLLIVQWYALVRQLLGRSVTWRDRAYIEPANNSSTKA
jgi:glycosyltransferase involved in cell wall biosynthesis